MYICQYLVASIPNALCQCSTLASAFACGSYLSSLQANMISVESSWTNAMIQTNFPPIPENEKTVSHSRESPWTTSCCREHLSLDNCSQNQTQTCIHQYITGCLTIPKQRSRLPHYSKRVLFTVMPMVRAVPMTDWQIPSSGM